VFLTANYLLVIAARQPSNERVRQHAFHEHRPKNGTDERFFFGHLHFMKTAGTSLNNIMARRYHGVCGHKGYSFDQEIEPVFRQADDPNPYYRKLGFGPDRVRIQIMVARGFQNCALVSHEMDWQIWINTTALFKNLTKVLLIPYREPVDHFLSICNHHGIHVSSLLKNGCSDYDKCLQKNMDRFSDQLFDIFDKVIIYDYDDIHSLINLLDNYMPRRILELSQKHRFSSGRNISEDKILRDQTNSGAELILGKCEIKTLRRLLRARVRFFEFAEQHKNEKRLTILDALSFRDMLPGTITRTSSKAD